VGNYTDLNLIIEGEGLYMVKVCLACFERVYIRMLLTGKQGVICEACQIKAMSEAISLESKQKREENILENIFRKY
jgi:hypothetical protein